MTINIALTSYPRRITNCVSVIESVLNNTIMPDRVYLTLSHSEFRNYEQDLPKELLFLVMTSDKVVLNWVEENTKSMKKVFPILQYLEDDDIIIDIDDDMIVPKDFISSRMADFRNYGEMHPISSNVTKTMNIDSLVMSSYSLFQKKMLNGYEKFLTKGVLDTFNDDRTYLYLIHMNGYKLKPCTSYCVNQGIRNMKALDISPHGDYKYVVGQRYDDAVKGVVARLSNGRSINDCFGLFNPSGIVLPSSKKVADASEQIKQKTDVNTAKLFEYGKKNKKHDLVYVLGRGSKYNNLEIKISITSMIKFCSDWIGTIYVVGENPKISNPMVKHIYVPDITRSNKDANIIYKILSAINKIPTLSENFLFCSDDILVTRKSKWEDFEPRYVFEYNQNDEFRKQLYEQSKNNTWDKLLLQTLDRFIGCREHIYFYEPHIFAPINKTLFKKMCSEVDFKKQRDVIVMSLWFNWLNLKNPKPRFDHQSIFTKDMPDLSYYQRHMTYNDKAFGVEFFRRWLVDLVSIDDFKSEKASTDGH